MAYIAQILPKQKLNKVQY